MGIALPRYVPGSLAGEVMAFALMGKSASEPIHIPVARMKARAFFDCFFIRIYLPKVMIQRPLARFFLVIINVIKRTKSAATVRTPNRSVVKIAMIIDITDTVIIMAMITGERV